MYKAEIMFTATEDNFEQGEIGTSSNDWNETLTAKTTEELKAKVLETTYSTELYDEQINDYDHATEYWTSYLTNVDNQGEATERELTLWEQGKLRLWSVNCHILVSEVTETKAELN